MGSGGPVVGPPTDKLLLWGGLEESQQERP